MKFMATTTKTITIGLKISQYFNPTEYPESGYYWVLRYQVFTHTEID